MKTDVRRSIVQIETEVLSELVKEVRETLATDVKLPESKSYSFTAADLWNIRRNKATAMSRFSR